MKIGLFMAVWNEAYILEQVLQYYKGQGVTDIFIFDNGSDDHSVEIAKRHGANVEMTKVNTLDDRNYLYVKNEVWKDYRNEFDYVICCDADEVLYSQYGIVNALLAERPSVVQPTGWNVYSELPPDPADILKVNTGFIDQNFSKCVCFDPKRIEEMNFVWGAHSCNPVGDVEYNTMKAYLMHFRCLGGVQRMIDRHKAYAERMSEFNRARGLGFHYFRSDKEIRDEWQRNIARSSKATFIPHE